MLRRKALTIVYHSGSNILNIQDLPVTFHLPKQTLQTSVGIRITEGANQGQGSPADGVWEIQGDHNGHKVEASLLGLLNLLSRWSRLLMFLYETLFQHLQRLPRVTQQISHSSTCSVQKRFKLRCFLVLGRSGKILELIWLDSPWACCKLWARNIVKA